MAGWIAVDLDCTLALYDRKKHAPCRSDGTLLGPSEIGDPIPPMVARVRRWLKEGHDVRIFTARVAHYPENAAAIQRWCEKHLGRRLVVTNCKDGDMMELWDDRAVQVLPNLGEPVGYSSRGLL